MTAIRRVGVEQLPASDTGSSSISGANSGPKITAKITDRAPQRWENSADPVYVTIGGRIRAATLLWRSRPPGVTRDDYKLVAVAAVMVLMALASLSL